VKALAPYSPVYCVAHRLNNVIKTCFYQTSKKKSQSNDDSTNIILELLYSSDSEDDVDNHDGVVASSFDYD